MTSEALAITIAKQHNVKVLLNPAPAMTLARDFLDKVDILVLNETESETITNFKVTDVEDAEKVISCIQNMGGRQVIVTMGDKGAVYNNRENETVHSPAPHVKAIDTTAAGDSFIGAMVVTLSRGKSIDEAVYYGNMVGALTVTKKGAQTSLPDEHDVEKFIDLINSKITNKSALRGRS
jgi:ribokinase